MAFLNRIHTGIRLTDRVTYWAKLEAGLYAEQTITKAMRTPINFIIHTRQEMNDGLAHGRYVFIGVAKDGIALYESDDTELHKPRPKTPAQALAIAQEYFDEWTPSASGCRRRQDSAPVKAASKTLRFLRHQSTERLYHCVLLVCTFHTPLCRARHKGDYAEQFTMPMGSRFHIGTNALASIDAA